MLGTCDLVDHFPLLIAAMHRHLQSLTLASGMAGGKDDKPARLDLLWKDFFRAPSKWWDERSSKRRPGEPDFKHKETNEPLWMEKRKNPPWVRDELIRRGYPVGQLIETADAFPASFIWTCCKTRDLQRGTRLHHEIQERGLDEKMYSDALITMYAKCGVLEKAQTLLDVHSSSSVIAWTALIAGYAQQGEGENALTCFERMQHDGISPNGVTYVSVLKACTLMKALDKGKQLHDEVLSQGLLEHNIELGNTLVDMYAKCDALPQAHAVLKDLSTRDVISWTALIAGYTQKGQGQQALECFEQMQLEGIPPNARTYTYILKMCAEIGAFDKGKEIHAEISRQRILNRRILAGALVEMYVKCGALSEGQSALEKLSLRNVASWNALIEGYVKMGQEKQALECFELMQSKNILPDVATYVCILQACGVVRAIDKGKQIHNEISRQGLLEHNKELGGALADMYAMCDARPKHKVF
ncbi:hypothetical protein GOP47_0007818 [Adiantum capillus-veneris]|uniref:Pentatricopeptide repeat-containing protein n=1 Tax=Adiantum capillus-veneris TaxID=13818 RepID=A0A9D4ZJP0_ADICA|nr:hypothetical protein GOP47_0007818 [Adiantum capillus-veneris]